MRRVGTGRSPLGRARGVGTLVIAGSRIVAEVERGHCESAQRFADRLAFPRRIQDALWQVFERWDGHGLPHALKGEAIALPVRVVQGAHDAELYRHLGGVDAAVAMARERAGHAYDPAIAARFGEQAARLLAPAAQEEAWDAVLAAEPGPRPRVDGAGIAAAARALADFVDLKGTYLVGHSSGVANLAAGAARRCGLPKPDAVSLFRAGCLHDLGRVAVSSGIWGNPGPLTEGEWERVRLHAY